MWRSSNRKFVNENNLLNRRVKNAISACDQKPSLRGLASTAGNENPSFNAGTTASSASAYSSTMRSSVPPLTNSIVCQAGAEADAFGLNAAQERHGFAMAAMRLSTYRKLKPGPLEEIIFYDHPSGYDRVHGSMVWFKEHQSIPVPVGAPSATPAQAQP